MMADTRYTKQGEPTRDDLELCLRRFVAESGNGVSSSVEGVRSEAEYALAGNADYDGLARVPDRLWSRGQEAGTDNEPLLPDGLREIVEEAGVILVRAGYRDTDETLWDILWEAQRYCGDWQAAEECFPGLLDAGWEAEVDPYWAEQLETAKAAAKW